MTKRIEEELNLPPMNKVLDDIRDNADIMDVDDDSGLPPEDLEYEDIAGALEKYKSVNRTFGKIDDFKDNDEKLKILQDKAIEAHDDLMSQGLSTPPAMSSAGYFEPAVSSLNIAVDIEKVKINNKLKLLQIELETRKVALQERKLAMAEHKLRNENIDDNESDTGQGGGVLASRADIVAQFQEILNQQKNDK